MCSDLLAQFKAGTKDALMRLDADLRDECTRNEWTLDGHWPKFTSSALFEWRSMKRQGEQSLA